MAFSHGRQAAFSVNDGGSLRDFSGYLSEAGLPREKDMSEITVLQATGKQWMPGLISTTIPLSGYFDPTVDGYLNTIMGLSAATAFEYYPAGSPVGATKPKYTGNCWLTSYEITTAADGVATFTAEFAVEGNVTRAVA